MNEVETRGRYFEDFEVGQEFTSPARTVTQTDIVNFACLSGDFNEVQLALNLNPLIHSDNDAEILAREMLLAHEKWLPNFAEAIEALKRSGEK